jgi:hypothetical protein
MRRAAGGVLVLLPIIAVLVAAAWSPAGQQRSGNDAKSPAIDANGPYEPVPNWFKPLHEGKVQCVSGVTAETPNRIYVVTEVEVPAGDTFRSGAAGGRQLLCGQLQAGADEVRAQAERGQEQVDRPALLRLVDVALMS